MLSKATSWLCAEKAEQDHLQILGYPVTLQHSRFMGIHILLPFVLQEKDPIPFLLEEVPAARLARLYKTYS